MAVSKMSSESIKVRDDLIYIFCVNFVGFKDSIREIGIYVYKILKIRNMKKTNCFLKSRQTERFAVKVLKALSI